MADHLSYENKSERQCRPDGRFRTRTCGELRPSDVGAEARLAGWVDTIRDHGGILFLDLRDHYGLTQIVFHDAGLRERLAGVSRESVLSILGEVTPRDAETVNPALATGEIELRARDVEVLSHAAAELPFPIRESHKTREELRLKYRFLDLRNPEVHEKIIFRAKVIAFLRERMAAHGFLEIQTPILTASSPEGARDYLVPSRKHHGMFYALPQAPQQFKQLLMVSGFDRYFQIAPCFRDEDARADRAPGEFYQLDFEMSFATQEDVFQIAEDVMFDTFTRFTEGGAVTPPPFPRIPYRESMLRYGTDKPDLRNPLVICDLTDFFADVEFKAFQRQQVRGIVVRNCAGRPRSFFDRMVDYATEIGMKGLGYVSVGAQTGTAATAAATPDVPTAAAPDSAAAAAPAPELKGPIAKFLSPEKQRELAASLSLKPDDTLFFISDVPALVNKYAGQIRSELGARLDLIETGAYRFCFIVDYPMYEIDAESGKLAFTHNPFSMPQGELAALETKDPLEILAYQYDIVCNGVELSSGAVRNHRPDIMKKAFEIAGYAEEELTTKFPALLNAFHYGAPPHAGMAPGLDRIVMLLLGEENIREVIAFPMNSSAQDTMMGAPGEVTEAQLREVHIKLR
ncbi:MAG: aspartate--tRNA ligase [Clostridiales bacterium]|jgi:aspartyl-tRNA synthetase|nr:aspartate--tRNA ligase [Clostridiales bacterium]